MLVKKYKHHRPSNSNDVLGHVCGRVSVVAEIIDQDCPVPTEEHLGIPMQCTVFLRRGFDRAELILTLQNLSFRCTVCDDRDVV